MKYSEETLVAIVQAHPSVMNEIEVRDGFFRRNFDAEKRREIAPWGMARSLSDFPCCPVNHAIRQIMTNSLFFRD